MGHSHQHSDGQSSRNLLLAFFINLIFTGIELVGGLYTGSMAILADALHDFGDAISLGAAYYFEKLSGKKRNEKYSYGYRRFSLLGAIINSTILLLGSAFIVYSAIPKVLDPDPVKETGMMLFAIGGILANGTAYFILHKGHSLNERAVALHLMEDVLGWVAVLITAGVIYFVPWYFLDPLLSIFIAAFVSYNAIKNLKEGYQIFLQKAPKKINFEEVTAILNGVDKVKSVHDYHVWTLDGRFNILTIHIVVKENLDLEHLKDIKSQAKDRLKELGIDHATIEFELAGECCDEKEEHSLVANQKL